MKKCCITTALLLSCLLFWGQAIPVKKTFREDLSKVVGDYSNQFRSFLGELLVENPQSADYRSLLNISGAEECIITKYSAVGKSIFSWQALMFRTGDWDAAVKKYKSLFGSINNLSVSLEQTNLVFKGAYSKPAEELKFSSIIFSPGRKSANKLRVELLLETELMNWIVKILIYEKEKEDDERGKIIEH